MSKNAGAERGEHAGGDNLRFKVGPLGRSVGNREEHRRVVSNLGTSKVGESEVTSKPIPVSLVFESSERGIEISGTAKFAWVGECRRCLGDASGETTSAISELFSDQHDTNSQGEAGHREKSTVPEGDDYSGEIGEIVGGWIDLNDAVRDTVMLDLPLTPLCGDDCVGPAPDAFPVVPADAAGEENVELDPRWAALSELRLDPEEPEELT